jgi:hypothetical protein
MISRYTVVQYVPDPLADERINIGVIAWDEGGVAAKFSSNWKRIQSFGHEDVGYVRDFVKMTTSALEAPNADLFGNNASLDVSRLEKMIGEWHHSIQFTTPRTSVKGRDAVLLDVSPVFLRSFPSAHKGPRSRRTAAAMATKELQSAIAHRDPKYVDKLLKKNHSLKGQCASHQFPVALANGHLIAAIETISFEVSEHKQLELELEAVFWTCADVKNKNEEAPLAVFALAPKRSSELFRRARSVLRKLDVDLLTENSLSDWAKKQAAAAVPELKQKRLLGEAATRRNR